MRLDPWQKEVLDTDGNISLRSGRQTGKSTVISILAGEYAAKNANKTVMIIAAVERQAYLLFEKVLYYMEAKHASKVRQGKHRPTKSKIKLKNGSEIYCLPTGLSGYGIRGFTNDLLIADEAAFIPEAVYSAITPSLAARKNARMILLSTPFGRDTPENPNFFARSFKEGSNFKNFHISSEECPRISREFLDQEKARMTKRQYQQEYLGEFVDNLMQFFPDELIRSCMTQEADEGRRGGGAKGKTYFLGVDLARMGEDESTFSVVEMRPDNKLIHVDLQITTRTRLNESTKHIIELNRRYNFERIFLDTGGIGVGVYDHLLDEDSTRRKIVAIDNSERVLDIEGKHRTKLLKEDLYNNLLRLMESGKIALLNKPEVYHSLKSVQFDYTSDTRGRAHLKIFGSYTHVCESLIRCAWAIKYKNLNTWISYI